MSRDEPDEALGNIQIHLLQMFESLPVDDVLFAVDDNTDELRVWAGPEHLEWIDERIEDLRAMGKGDRRQTSGGRGLAISLRLDRYVRRQYGRK